ncbi:hypothetical protein EVAR_4998_1 [Eumeta japonica]|uniref:Uncharacterized protein n=1 Tax=Eumeta variegata TaxID=151549 RepID=A0A4C1UZV4_EUMVA|nr:hypothetical protein EVAR_4998_1 [Eumeta japonica]
MVSRTAFPLRPTAKCQWGNKRGRRCRPARPPVKVIKSVAISATIVLAVLAGRYRTRIGRRPGGSACRPDDGALFAVTSGPVGTRVKIGIAAVQDDMTFTRGCPRVAQAAAGAEGSQIVSAAFLRRVCSALPLSRRGARARPCANAGVPMNLTPAIDRNYVKTNNPGRPPADAACVAADTFSGRGARAPPRR